MKGSTETTGIVYLVETPREIFWSERKLTSQYKHLDFLYKNRARYKEMPEVKFKSYCAGVKKRIIHLTEAA